MPIKSNERSTISKMNKNSVSKKKEHGIRNMELAKKLYSEGVYYDWVITTCFYSAVHLVEYHILPCNIEGVHCKDIHNVKQAYNSFGKHAARLRLVSLNESSIRIEYKWLEDTSRNARYCSYKINKNQADKAMSYLSVIKKRCIK